MGYFGIISSAVLYHFTGDHIKVYYAIYLCYCLIIFKIFYQINKIIKNSTTVSVLIIIFYIFLITCPITYINNSPIMVLSGLKSFISPFFLSFFLIIQLTSQEKLNHFVKLIVYGGVFATIYCLFEVCNKYLNIFPWFNVMIYNYALIAKGGSLLIDTNVDLFDIRDTIIRPAGIFFNYTANGFFISSCFFMVLLTGKYFIKKIYMIRLITILLYIGVLLSTSRQNIILLHLVILFLIIIIKGRMMTQSFSDLKRGIRFALCLVGFVMLIGLYYFANHFNDLLGGLLDLSGEDSGSSKYIFDGLKLVPANIMYLLSERIIYGLFGIGFYNNIEVGLYNELGINTHEIHFLMYLIIEAGLLGFLLYWLVFFNVGLVCWRKYKRARITLDSDPNFYLLGLIIVLLFAGSLIHYPPQNICSNFIIALSIYIGFVAETKESIFKKAEAIYYFER